MSFNICRMCYQRLGVNFWITGNKVQTLQTSEFWICHIVAVATEIIGKQILYANNKLIVYRSEISFALF